MAAQAGSSDCSVSSSTPASLSGLGRLISGGGTSQVELEKVQYFSTIGWFRVVSEWKTAQGELAMYDKVPEAINFRAIAKKI